MNKRIYLLSALACLLFSVPALAQQPTKDELEQRFKTILTRKFEDHNIVLTADAQQEVDQIVNRAAAQITDTNQFDKLKRADKSFKKFADRLKDRSSKSNGSRQVTSETIDRALNGINISPPNSIHSQRVGGLCPLFPIC